MNTSTLPQGKVHENNKAKQERILGFRFWNRQDLNCDRKAGGRQWAASCFTLTGGAEDTALQMSPNAMLL